MEYTHIRHFQNTGYINGDGQMVKTRMTILSVVDEDCIRYKVSFCSRNENSFVKKVGVEEALKTEERSVEFNDEVNFVNVMNAITVDLAVNKPEHMPSAHRNFFDLLYMERGLTV